MLAVLRIFSRHFRGFFVCFFLLTMMMRLLNLAFLSFTSLLVNNE